MKVTAIGLYCKKNRRTGAILLVRMHRKIKISLKILLIFWFDTILLIILGKYLISNHNPSWIAFFAICFYLKNTTIPSCP
jgi:hypothetical protein